MLTGLNHLTVSVADLDRSFRFYVDVLGARPRARWANGAYLEIGSLWLCLNWQPQRAPITGEHDYTHFAFSIAANDFPRLVARLRAADVPVWQDNRSEGESFYFCDPDGHQLELHVGDLASRLAHCRQQPYRDMRFFDDQSA